MPNPSDPDPSRPDSPRSDSSRNGRPARRSGTGSDDRRAREQGKGATGHRRSQQRSQQKPQQKFQQGPRQAQPRSPHPGRPDIPEDVTAAELDPAVRIELRSLPKTLAENVGRHLVMAGRLLDEDPQAASEHAKAAQRLASRLPAVREAAGLVAYTLGQYTEALASLRAARRMTGSNIHWPIMADCERGLGRPERALTMAGAPETQTLDTAGRVEMRIVAAGARRDLGQIDAALVTLQTSELTTTGNRPWVARLRYAYADILLEAGREDDALVWFARAADADPDGETGAADRLSELEGIDFVDALDPDAEDQAEDPVPVEDSDTESPAEKPEDPEAPAG